MNEFQLKYGCNPNQKPSRIFMEDGRDLPVEILNGRPGYINFLDAFNGYQLVKELKKATGLPAPSSEAVVGFEKQHPSSMYLQQVLQLDFLLQMLRRRFTGLMKQSEN